MEQQQLGVNNTYVLFVGNMSLRINEKVLRMMVAPFGTVKDVQLVKINDMNAACGFAFVEMTDERAAARAIADLNGKCIDGLCLKVRLGL